MKAIFVVLVVFAVACNGEDYLTEPPDFLSPCMLKDPEFAKCFKRTVQRLFDQFSKGIPGIVDPADPYTLKKIAIEQSGIESANIQVELNNVVVKGFSNTKVTQVTLDPKKFNLIVKYRIPHIHIDADYVLNGRILLLPLQGKGDMFFDIEDLKVIIHADTHLYEKGNFTFLNFTKIRGEVDPLNVKSRLNNLFNGNKELEESTNKLFNEDWKAFFEALKPTVMETFEKLVYDELQQVFTKVPINFFISDIPKSTEVYK